MEEILERASSLGKLIAKQERFLKLREAEGAAGANKATNDLLESLESQRRKVAQLEAENRPVEPEDKRELQRLAGEVHSNPLLQDLAKTQADFMEMMNKVNGAIRQELGGDSSGPAE